MKIARLDEDERLALLSAYEAGDLDADRRRDVEVYLASSEEARSAVRRLERLRSLDVAREAPALPLDVRRSLGDLVEAKARRRVRRRRAGAAAGLAVAAAAGTMAVAMLIRAPRPGGPERKAAQATRTQESVVLRTGPGDYQLLSLLDRAVAFVSEDTEVVTSADPLRALHVRRGSVRVVVRREPRGPFGVSTAGAEILVHGTEFDLDVRDGATEVSVVRGEVEVRNGLGSQRLWAREKARVRPGEPPRMVFPVKALVLDEPPEILVPPRRRAQRR